MDELENRGGMIISIGEVVWDVFPDREVLGGAPVNVAYHLRCLGEEVRVVTRVGPDSLGRITLERLESLGLDLSCVQRDEALPTGRVNITLDVRNEPCFDIVAPAAWDGIDRLEALACVGDRPFDLVFGTLAQRDQRSREAVRALCDRAATCYYDVNLRPPFTTRDLVLESFEAADIVKMNGDELIRLGRWCAIDKSSGRDIAETFLSRYAFKVVVVTEGEDGSWLVTKDGYFFEPVKPVNVTDPVGAGDAFFAAFISGSLAKRDPNEILSAANGRGAYVASRPGATPEMND